MTAAVFAALWAPTLLVARDDAASGLSTQRYALLIGINQYGAPFGALKYCHNDMQSLKERLLRAGFDEENIVLMQGGTADSACWPSKANIERQLSLTLGLANENDFVLVAFSGHGLQGDGTTYLCPSDANLDKPEQTMVSLDTVYEQLEVSRAHQKTLLVDACRNEPILRGIRARSNVRGFAAELKEPPKGTRVLSSCEAGQWSAEDPDLEHGVFMHYLMQGLDGCADQQCAGNKNGRISLSELYLFAHDKTKKHVAKSHGILQRPVLRGEFVGEYEIAAVPVGIPSIADQGVPSSVSSNGLLKQAETHFTQGEHTKAIDTYAKAIRVEQDAAMLRSAYLKRSTAYVARGKEGDLEQALTDRLAAGHTALPLTVTADRTELKAGEDVNAIVKKGQVVDVTRITPFKGSVWLYVVSVDGNDAANGYILNAAVKRGNSSPAKSSASSGGQPTRTVSTGNSWTDNYIRRNGRPPSIWETPWWESGAEIRAGRANGTLR